MIDEKEKQDGMKACFDRRVDNKVERGLMRDPLIAYTRGFDDAIDWFKKALWHSQDEIPEGGKMILVKRWNPDGMCGDYKLFNTVEDLDLADFDRKLQWESFCEFLALDFTWCYIEDLLPKGGEK